MEILYDAIAADDVARVAAILEAHPELNARLNQGNPGYCFGATPLLMAVQRRNREMIDVLLRAGADINARSNWWAGSFGVLDNDLGLAPFLIERGAVVDAHAAARLGMLDRLKELIEAKPELVHARGGDGQTPLHFASSVEIAAYLLARGADIDARDIDHESTPAQYMVRDRQEVARHLVSRGCRTDVLMAAALGDIERVRRHLDLDPQSVRLRVAPADFPMRNPRAGGSIYIWTLGGNQTAHLVAREFGHEDVLRLLMERSPAELQLAMACELGDEELLEKTLALHPAIVSERPRLVDAAQNNHTQAVRLMLRAGWPVDARGSHRGTALHWAGYHGNSEMARLLIESGAPLDVKGDEWNATPLDWALHGSESGWHRKTGDYAGVADVMLTAGAPAPKLTSETKLPEAVREVLRRHGYS